MWRTPVAVEGTQVGTIREVTPTEVEVVTELYLDYCRDYGDHEPEPAVPERGPIETWIRRTTETDEAACLVITADGVILGFLLASVNEHPAVPGVVGNLEELYVRPGPHYENLRRPLVEAGISWARNRHADVIIATVAADAPWGDKEMAFWGSLDFEKDTVEMKRYFPSEGRS